MEGIDDNIEDQFEYNSSSDVEAEFEIELSDGSIFSKLFDFLKNGDNALIKLTKNSMTYTELKDMTEDPKKGKNRFNIDIICDFNVDRFKTYIFKSKNEEYNLYMDVKTFHDKIKKIKKDVPIKIVKRSKNETINIYTSDNLEDVAYFQPLVMQNIDSYNKEYKNKKTPNCLINTKKMYSDCNKISPTKYKKATLTGYDNYMTVEFRSLYQNDGQKFNYSPVLPYKNLNINLSLMPDVVCNPIVKSTIPIIKYDIPTNLLKNISKLGQLSDSDMEFFFEKEEQRIKIIINIKQYVTVYTYIMTLDES